MSQGNLPNTNRLRYKSDSGATVAADGDSGLASVFGPAPPLKVLFSLTYDGDGLILCVSQHPDRISDEVMSQHRQPVLWIICKLVNITFLKLQQIK